MGAKLEKITVTVTDDSLPLQEVAAQVYPSSDSPRIVFWLAQIRNTQGEIKACQKLEGLTEIAIKMGADYLKQRLTYGPADKYNAILYYDVETAPIRSVVFTPRDGAALTCE